MCFSFTKNWTRSTRTLVLPAPGPALMINRFARDLTASSCSSLKCCSVNLAILSLILFKEPPTAMPIASLYSLKSIYSYCPSRTPLQSGAETRGLTGGSAAPPGRCSPCPCRRSCAPSAARPPGRVRSCWPGRRRRRNRD